MSCQPSEAVLRSESLRRYYGISMFVPAGPTRERLRKLRGAPWYMSIRRISELSGISESTLCQIARGRRGGGRSYQETNEIHRDTEGAVAGVKPELNPPARGGGRVPPLGARRRLQALAAAGFPLRHLSELMDWGVDPQPVHRFITGKSGSVFVMHSTHVKACEAFDKLELADPADLGFSKISINRAKASAARNGYAPPHCWDPDTIDDPDAFPEWTGQCGTPAGLRIHYREDIPSCQPCLDARERSDRKGSSTVGMVDGLRLRAARERRGYSLVQLGEVLGVHKDTIYYWETGRSSPRGQEMLDRIITALSCNYEDIREEGS